MSGTDLDLRIDEIVVECDGDAAATRPVIERALAELAERLGKTSFDKRQLRQLALERLQISDLPPDALLGARGAARLADAMYEQIVGRLK